MIAQVASCSGLHSNMHTACVLHDFVRSKPASRSIDRLQRCDVQTVEAPTVTPPEVRVYLSVVCTPERSPVDSWLPTTASWRTARWTGARLTSLKPSLQPHNMGVRLKTQTYSLSQMRCRQRRRQ